MMQTPPNSILTPTLGPYELQPRRGLGLLHATSLVVGVTIGTGIFLKSAVMAQSVGTPLELLAAWTMAGFIALFGALSFAELGALLPDAGGEYVYLRAAYGELPAFLYVVNSFVVGGAGLSAYGAAVAIFLSDIYPLPGVWHAWHFQLFGASHVLELGVRQLIAVGVIAVFGLINCAGVELGGRVQTMLSIAKVLSVLALALGVFWIHGADAAHLAAPAGVAGGGLSGFGAALFAALWAYSGWQFLPMAASEVERPERNLPRAIIGGTLLVLALYLLINVAYIQALPFWQITTANSTAYPEAPSLATRTVATLLGEKAVPVAALIFLLSCAGALNGGILTRARVPYAAARDGLFFTSFGRLHPRSRVPVFSTALVCAWAALLAGSGTFDQLTNMVVLWYAIFWTPVVLAVIVLRRKMPEAKRPYRVPGYPLVPIAFALVTGWIVVNAFVTSPLESLITLVLILSGLPLYPLVRRKKRELPS